MRLLLVALLFAACAQADERVKRMTARLSEEAEAFANLAPQLLSRETFEQRALKPPSRFKPRIGPDALKEPPSQWQTRKIVSEYAFSTFAGSREALHEFRQAIRSDNREIQKADKALDNLAKAVKGTDDERKRRLLREFEKLGLRGAVTDLGPMILLFTRREIEKYEFLFAGNQFVDGKPVYMFSYKQLDGPDRMTIFDAAHPDRVTRLKPSGEVWVSAADYLPMRIIMKVQRKDAEVQFRDELVVNYVMTPHGVIAPSSALHREWQGTDLIAENKIEYEPFHRFGASSDIKFDAAPIPNDPAKPKP